MLIVSLTSDKTSLQDLRTYADWIIRPHLLSTGGVAQVSVHGGDIKEYQILISPGKMKHFGVSLSDVMACTRGMNTNTNGGVRYEYGNEYIIRGITSTNDLDKLGACIVKKNGESVITLADVADIKVGNQSPKLGTASEKARPAVLLTVTKQPYTSTLKLTEQLNRSLDELKGNLPADVHISTDIFRQADFIESSVDNVQKSLIEGAIFVVIVLMIFLANARTTIISLVTIPLSFLVAMIVLNAMGISINTMTLGGLAIAIGSLVDDAIVDVENVYKHIRQNRQLPETDRVPIIELVYNASREVRMPILNSTLIIIVSFAPLFFLSGMEGRMLIPLGIAFVTALLASTLVALTLTPVLCSYMLGKSKGEMPKEAFVAVWLKKYYHTALLWVLDHTRPVIISAAALFVIALAVFLTLGSSFLPKFNEGSFTINISSLPGISLEESDSIGARAERLLLQVPEIKTVARKTGRAELDEHALGVNVSEIEAPFQLDKRSHEEVLNDVRRRLSVLAGANIEIGQPISHRIDAMLSGTQASIAIKLFGSDLNKMFTIGNQIKKACKDIDGIADLNVEQQIERPELKIIPLRQHQRPGIERRRSRHKEGGGRRSEAARRLPHRIWRTVREPGECQPRALSHLHPRHSHHLLPALHAVPQRQGGWHHPAQPAAGTHRRHLRTGGHHGRSEHTGNHRLHLALRHRHTKRHAPRDRIQASAHGGRGNRQGGDSKRFALPAQPNPDDSPHLGPRPRAARPRRRTAGKRDTVAPGEGNSRRTDKFHITQRIYNTSNI